ncbi:AraC family transcriptional regulator [Brenneria goodwinii]|uniref:AraC family transcriptional regulator n=1 Tax=Brenneria goodwinii TaxID=1109412 RepID=UPI000EF1D065|nr:AraC family transcriptional regulator [Brenneria goodwinii]MCG8158293.1 AraC family transcriptional regulator [Brenneria goodwinii]MCG8162381.1 AraC family transcriptional regulator [Brenneria goodwinii]MCG8167343.1 AraC family transcriptional regulator [Brenneria goodwinii]MCG8171989.1 AraC family transcriptional regulator [Brenneria goodwinii]MCG8175604.1 AraC family transcriptional regulator [Brenneria goodwinii]
MEKQLHELRELASGAGNQRTETGIPRVAMVQGEIPEHLLAAVYEPMINLILTGSKSMTVGDRTYRYDPATYFVMSVDLPAVGKVYADEQTGAPYLAVSLTPEPEIIADLLAGLPDSGAATRYDSGFAVAPVTAELLDAWLRMLRLINKPQEIAALAPAYEREILFRVLQGPLGWMLRDIATPDTHLSRIYAVINWIKQNYMHAVRVEELAEMAALSVSAFHRHFRAITALSPVQYQKRIRLMQARTMLATRSDNITTIALSVGYQSHTQFSREYSRLFGRPPSAERGRVN